MMNGINPRQMQGMMRKMGISQENIPSNRVIIEKKDGEKIIIENPEIMRVKMNGQSSFQISGEEHIETEEPKISKEDLSIIIEKTGCSEEEAKKALEETNDLTEAILSFS